MPAADLAAAVQDAIARATGSLARIAEWRAVGGGCINDARRATLADGRRFFVKSNPAPLPFMFEREAQGLAALASFGAIRVPRPVCTGGGEGVAAFIVLEWIEPGAPRADFQRELGRQLALLHRSSAGPRFGFDGDGYIGSTPQPNAWCDDWVEFWRTRRLGFQLDLLARAGLADASFVRLGERVLECLPSIIAEPHEPACLLHGDLWSGNVVVGEGDEPVLVDPAAYWGRREADIAMTVLFGGFGPEFRRGYDSVWPLADGSERRIEVFKLYHLLNHANLFGGGYLASCEATMRRIAEGQR